jgi:3-hydroxy acid dehydrogenase / malonic semialdehyde reductase
MNSIVFITGATAGFGKACAEKFASANYDLIITGRRNDRLIALQNELQSKYKIAVTTRCFDVRDQPAVEKSIDSLPASQKNIDILINNAGLASGFAPIHEGDLSDWNTMIDTNVKGLLYVSRAVMPLMVRQQHGHIFNIGSTAAKDVYPNGNIYCASKHAVDAISQAMRIDLLPYNIRVTAIHPGAAKTEFSIVRFKGDEDQAKNVYKGFTPLTAENIAEVIFFCATLPPHVCINDLVITPTQQANANFIHRKK